MRRWVCGSFQRAVLKRLKLPLGPNLKGQPARAYCASSENGYKVITSTSNSHVKRCCKLRTDRSHRLAEGSVLVVGLTPILELSAELENAKIKTLFWAGQDDPPTGLQYSGLLKVTEPVMRKIAGIKSAEGLVAAAEFPLPKEVDFVSLPARQLTRLLVMDGIQDPGNLGTLLRTAFAFGWQGAYLLPGCCDPFNDKALRASRGAAFMLPLATGDWQSLQKIHAHHSMISLAAAPSSQTQLPPKDAISNSEKLDFKNRYVPVALVLGSEGQGLSAVAAQNSKLLSVPMSGSMESLSVSQAGAILLFMFSKGLPQLLSSLELV